MRLLHLRVADVLVWPSVKNLKCEFKRNLMLKCNKTLINLMHGVREEDDLGWREAVMRFWDVFEGVNGWRRADFEW